MKEFFLKKKRYWVLIATILAIVVLLLLSERTTVRDEIEIEPVTRGTVEEIVSETGFVQPAQAVDMAFEFSGRVINILVVEGAVVEKGSPLVELDAADKDTQLRIAEAGLRLAQTRLDELLRGADTLSLNVTESSVFAAQTAVQSAKDNLEKVSKQQNQLVENAYRTFLSSGLEAYLVNPTFQSSSVSYVSPTVSGIYTSDELGSYFLDPYSSDSPSGGSFKYTGLEKGVSPATTAYPSPVGTRGLYVTFPEDFAKGTHILWEIPIPNNRGSQYTANLNTYNAALEARELAIKTAENALKTAEANLAYSEQQLTQVSSSARDEQIEAQRAIVAQAWAAVDAAQIAVDKMTLRAPFTGKVTEIFVEEGEIVSPSLHVLSFISDENFELMVYVSESDIQEVTIDDTASVIFDAYDDARFEAKVTKIAPTAELLDGVRAFRVTLQFLSKDERIRSGLSADIDILAERRENVLVVPTRAVVDQENGNFVRILNGNTVTYVPVVPGLRGSDGMTEIVSGVDEGTEVITFASLTSLEKLDAN